MKNLENGTEFIWPKEKFLNRLLSILAAFAKESREKNLHVFSGPITKALIAENGV